MTPAAALPTVTTVLVTYEYGHYLPRTLDSYFAQDYPAELMDLIIVDDGSTDDTAEVVAEYERRHPDRIQFHRQQNAGQTAGLNRGLALATGDLIALLDSDDTWPADKIRRQVELLGARPEVTLVYCDGRVIDAYDKVTAETWRTPYRLPMVCGDYYAEMMGGDLGSPVLTSTIVFRRELLAQSFPIPATVAWSDFWFAGRAACTGEVAYVDGLSIGYRQHGGNNCIAAVGSSLAEEITKFSDVRRLLVLWSDGERLTTPQLVACHLGLCTNGRHSTHHMESPFFIGFRITDEQRARSREFENAAFEALVAADHESALRNAALAAIADPYNVRAHDLVRGVAQGYDFTQTHGGLTHDPLADAPPFRIAAGLREFENDQTAIGDLIAAAERTGAGVVLDAIGLTSDAAFALAAHCTALVPDERIDNVDILLVTEMPGGSVGLELRVDYVLTRRRLKYGGTRLLPERLGSLTAPAVAEPPLAA